jgi:hypothetical protein
MKMYNIFIGKRKEVRGKRLLVLLLNTAYRLPLTTYLFLVVFTLYDCSNIQSTGTETTDEFTLAGTVTFNDEPVADAKIILRPVDYVPSIPEPWLPKRSSFGGETWTDAEGRFLLTGIDEGDYALEVRAKDNRGALLKTSMTESRTLPDIEVRPAGSITGTVPGHFRGQGTWVGIIGTDHIGKTDSTGRFVLGRIPAAILTLKLISDSPLPDVSAIAVIEPGRITEVGHSDFKVDYSSWGYSRKIYINTAADGANVPGDVMDFPLLVHLAGTTFDFSRAQEQGNDVRIVKSDGTPLFYEIERWDRASEAAEIWVRMDTVYGGNDEQHIYIYTGQSDAPALSSGPAVFDTLLAYRGVWHMNGIGTDTLARVPDASAAANHGTFYGVFPAVFSISPTYRGISFNGTDQYLFTDNVYDGPVAFTMSFWMKTDTDGGGRIFSFGDEHLGGRHHVDRWIWMGDTGKLYFGVYNFMGDQGNLHSIVSGQPYNDNTWHHICALFSLDHFGLYVDGEIVAEEPDMASFGMVVYPGSFTIAHFTKSEEADTATVQWFPLPSNRFFEGSLDEVRISFTKRTADWVKLSYESQRADANFIRIEE